MKGRNPSRGRKREILVHKELTKVRRQQSNRSTSVYSRNAFGIPSMSRVFTRFAPLPSSVSFPPLPSDRLRRVGVPDGEGCEDKLILTVGGRDGAPTVGTRPSRSGSHGRKSGQSGRPQRDRSELSSSPSSSPPPFPSVDPVESPKSLWGNR